jgi:hypothetical protein
LPSLRRAAAVRSQCDLDVHSLSAVAAQISAAASAQLSALSASPRCAPALSAAIGWQQCINDAAAPPSSRMLSFESVARSFAARAMRQQAQRAPCSVPEANLRHKRKWTAPTPTSDRHARRGHAPAMLECARPSPTGRRNHRTFERVGLPRCLVSFSNRFDVKSIFFGALFFGCGSSVLLGRNP